LIGDALGVKKISTAMIVTLVALFVSLAGNATAVTYRAHTAYDCFDDGLVHTSRGLVREHPAGWPCARFTHPKWVISDMRYVLTKNGFWSSGMRFYRPSTRQITFVGIQDGERAHGIIVRRGSRRIQVQMHGDPQLGSSATWYDYFTLRLPYTP
jgi:hypothetical protein